MFDRFVRNAASLPVDLMAVIAITLSLALPAAAQTVEDGRLAAQQGDPATAIAIWAPLAEAGDPQAQHLLAQTHWGGWWGVPEDLAQVALWHMRAADQGYVPAFVSLGHMHADGHHFPQDKAAAVAWYARAADAGDADGQYHLANAYYHGVGVSPDYAQAMILWRKAHEQGHQGARAELCAEISDYCKQ